MAKDALNQVAEAVEANAKKPAAEEHDDDDGSCKMCGAMRAGLDESKLGSFMKNNPFKKN